jgi:hypothetical protein
VTEGAVGSSVDVNISLHGELDVAVKVVQVVIRFFVYENNLHML